RDIVDLIGVEPVPRRGAKPALDAPRFLAQPLGRLAADAGVTKPVLKRVDPCLKGPDLAVAVVGIAIIAVAAVVTVGLLAIAILLLLIILGRGRARHDKSRAGGGEGNHELTHHGSPLSWVDAMVCAES